MTHMPILIRTARQATLALLLCLAAAGCSGDVLNPVGGSLLGRNAGGIREVVQLPASSTRQLFERIATLKPPVSNLRIGRKDGFAFRSLLRFELPADSIAAAAGGAAIDLTVDSLHVILGWRPQEATYRFGRPWEGPFEVHRPDAAWNEATAFFDTTSATETVFPSSPIPGVSITRSDTLAVIRLPLDAIASDGSGLDKVELLLEPGAGDDFMMASYSSEVSTAVPGNRRPTIVVFYRMDDQVIRYETVARQDVSWGAREGFEPDGQLLLASGLRLSPVLQFALPDTVPPNATVNFARIEFELDLDASVFDVLPLQMDAIAVSSATGDTVYTTFTTTTFSILTYEDSLPQVGINFSQSVIRNWISGSAANLGMALRAQFDSDFGWVTIRNPRISFVYSIAPELE